MIADLFPTVKLASRRLLRLARRKSNPLKVVGFIHENNQRARYVYGLRRVKVDNVDHEVGLANCLRAIRQAYPTTEFQTGHSLSHLADAIAINGDTLYIEYDNGTMTYAEIENNRLDKKYEGCDGFIVFITPTEIRRDGILAHPGKRGDILYACTVDDLLGNTRGAIVVDCDGNPDHLFREDDGEDDCAGNAGA